MVKLLITEYKNKTVSIELADDKAEGIYVLPDEKEILGDIYVGRVSKVMPSIKAYFVNISADTTVFLPFDECNPSHNYKQGDELLVRIIKERVKTKDAVGSTALSIMSEHGVLEYSDSFSGSINVSKKITDKAERDRLRSILPSLENGFSFTYRTNAQGIDSEILQKEYFDLEKKLKDIILYGASRTCYSRMYKAPSGLYKQIISLDKDELSEIITDKKEIFDSLSLEIGDYIDENGIGLRLYQDDNLKLSKLYSVEKHMNEALSRNVWLKCGGYLVIEETEALNVIDVNSGKYEGKKDKESRMLINRQAAYEVARQLKLRNLSGIIMVDFINTDRESMAEIKNILSNEFKKDKARPIFVDFTKLQIAEITRRRESPTLSERFRGLNP